MRRSPIPNCSPTASRPIRIVPDKDANTLTVTDNGIGMDRQELIDNLGTIARSGTKAFLERLTEAKDGAGLIGQFGVGFYSAFMVADRIVVTSRRAGSGEAWVWRSSGGSRLRDRAGAGRRPRASRAAPRSCCTSRRTPRNISRPTRSSASSRSLFRPHPVPDLAGAGGGRAAADQLGQRAVAALEIGADGGGIHARPTSRSRTPSTSRR